MGFLTFVLVGAIVCAIIAIGGFIAGIIGDALDGAAPVLAFILGLAIIGFVVCWLCGMF